MPSSFAAVVISLNAVPLRMTTLHGGWLARCRRASLRGSSSTPNWASSSFDKGVQFPVAVNSDQAD